MCKEIIVEHFASECCKPKQIYLWQVLAMRFLLIEQHKERIRTQYKNMYSTCTNDLKPLEMQVSTDWFES